MPEINKIEKCLSCGKVFKTLRAGDAKEIKVIQDFLADAPLGHGIRINTPLFIRGPESDEIYGLCPCCADYILVDIMSRMIKRRRKILFQDFDGLRKKLKEGK